MINSFLNKIEIIPAILPKDFAELEDKTESVKGLVKMVQIDICDGQFVPNATWPYKKEDDSFKNITKEEQGLPGWQNLNFEIDLMVNRPEEVVEDWVNAGASRVIIHAEAKGDLGEAVAKLLLRVEIGLALNIDTPIKVIEPYKDQVQFIQLMGIDHIGFQHQEFDAKVVEKIKEVKAKYPNMPISIDGGVSLVNADRLVKAGAVRLIAGSAIFESDNIPEMISRLESEVGK